MRALQMGMATASQWLFNFVVAKGTLSMFATMGSHGFGTYFLYGSFCFTMVVFAWFFVPETKGEKSSAISSLISVLILILLGLALEDMDELFAFGSVRGKFVPSRVSRLEDEQNAKKDTPAFEHVD
jgi:hypothetical protein